MSNVLLSNLIQEEGCKEINAQKTGNIRVW